MIGDRMNKKNRFFLLLGIILIILILVTALFLQNKKDDEDVIDRDHATQIYFYDFGNSKIEIIKKNELVVLVDTGLEEDLLELLDSLQMHNIQKIDYLILTNRDDECIENASFILDNYQVSYVYLNDYSYTSDSVSQLEETLQDNYAITVTLTSDEKINFGNLEIDIYPYMSDASMEDKGLMVRVSEGKNIIYLTGDISEKRFNEIKDSYLLVTSNPSLYDVSSQYYIYDGKEKIDEKNNLLKRNIIVYLDRDKVVIDK